jgi:tetratricopeptide (TPR) repeat protein
MLKSHWLRILPPALALCIYYFVLCADFSAFKTFSPAVWPPELTEEDSRKLLEASKALRREGHPNKALKLLSRLRAAYPQNHIYIQETADLYHQTGQFKEEAAAWEDFMKVSPQPVESCPQIGIAYQQIGQAAQAISAFQRCVEADSKNLDFAYYLAYEYEITQQFNKAAETYLKAISHDRNNFDLRVGLARVRMHQSDYSQAMKISGGVLKQSPSNVDAMLVMGLSLWHQGDLARARKYLEKGVNLANDYADFYVALGRIAEQENQKRKAREAYTQSLRLQPNNHEIAQRLELLQEGVR